MPEGHGYPLVYLYSILGFVRLRWSSFPSIHRHPSHHPSPHPSSLRLSLASKETNSWGYCVHIQNVWFCPVALLALAPFLLLLLALTCDIGAEGGFCMSKDQTIEVSVVSNGFQVVYVDSIFAKYVRASEGCICLLMFKTKVLKMCRFGCGDVKGECE